MKTSLQIYHEAQSLKHYCRFIGGSTDQKKKESRKLDKSRKIGKIGHTSLFKKTGVIHQKVDPAQVKNTLSHSLSKEPRLQGGALEPKFSRPKIEIPKQVRDDSNTGTEPSCHAELVSASGLLFSAFGRHIFHPRPQDGVFRCDLNKPSGVTIVSAFEFTDAVPCFSLQARRPL
jgi:hypothetical protein